MSKDIDDLILELVDSGGPSSGARSDDDGVDEYGPDLYKDEEDRQRLMALPEVERERILNERSEERQRNLERLEVRKLLSDGRREDTTRRSTRAKGSGTSQALNELARRREEKSKSRSKRHRRSPTPERKRNRYSDESGGEYTDEEDTEARAEHKAKKRTPTLDEIQAIVLRREQIERWLYAPYFEKTVIGAMVRVYIGDDNKTPVYRLCQVIDVVPWHKTYKISDSVSSNQAFKLKHGGAERVFSMDIISNRPLSQSEYNRYINTLEYDHVPLPDLELVQNKIADIQEASNYVLNDKEVAAMIEKKQQVAGRKVNVSMEQAVLLSKLEHAKTLQDENMAREIVRKLDMLKEEVETDMQQRKEQRPLAPVEPVMNVQSKTDRLRDKETQAEYLQWQKKFKKMK
ncbi:hypothetical protein BX666DRAFT_1849196 [Dichotomocladium elegans]|nr:hypothetical protein BX666DRAFT_1849196 [Dichotomocladium elegans]